MPIQLPIGEEKAFRGVVDLVAQKAYVYQPDGSGKFTESAIPADMTDAAAAAREALIEMVAEADESLMEKFFEAGTLTQEQLVAGLRAATASGAVFPLLCTAPGAEHRRATAARCDRRIRAVAGASDPFRPSTRKPARRSSPRFPKAARPRSFVWKTIADPFAGRITLFRVMSGVVKTDSTVHNKSRDTTERLGHVVLLQGKTQTNVPNCARAISAPFPS